MFVNFGTENGPFALFVEEWVIGTEVESVRTCLRRVRVTVRSSGPLLDDSVPDWEARVVRDSFRGLVL